MLVSEIFHSLQGEGELAGVPSVFVRLAGCNLRCNWCDTPYASWNPEGEKRSVSEIVEQVASYPAQHVVITGGEPMIAAGIHELATAFRQRELHITIETAATIAPDGIPCDLASLSPKLSNSAPDERASKELRERHEQLRWQPEVLRAWLRGYTFQLKFVVAGPNDVDEVERLLEELGEPIPRSKILLMPEGTTREVLQSRVPWLSELCKARGYRYAPRLQIELYGNRRGT